MLSSTLVAEPSKRKSISEVIDELKARRWAADTTDFQGAWELWGYSHGNASVEDPAIAVHEDPRVDDPIERFLQVVTVDLPEYASKCAIA